MLVSPDSHPSITRKPWVVSGPLTAQTKCSQAAFVCFRRLPFLPHPPSHGTECGRAGCISCLIKADCRVEMPEQWDRRSLGLRLWGASVSAQLMLSSWACSSSWAWSLWKWPWTGLMPTYYRQHLWAGLSKGRSLSLYCCNEGAPHILVPICAPGRFLHSMMTVFPSVFSTSELSS